MKPQIPSRLLTTPFTVGTTSPITPSTYIPTSSSVSNIIWQWNGADTTQFDSPVQDSNPTWSSVGISVADSSAYTGGPYLTFQFQNTVAVGGLFWPVNDLPVDLPRRFIVKYRVMYLDPNNCYIGPVFWTGSTSAPVSVCFGVQGTSTTCTCWRFEGTLTSQQNSPTLNQVGVCGNVTDRSGAVYSVEHHQGLAAASTTTKLSSFVNVQSFDASFPFTKMVTADYLTGSPSSAFDNVNLTKFGFGAYAATGVTAEFWITDFCIMKHPADWA